MVHVSERESENFIFLDSEREVKCVYLSTKSKGRTL